MRFITLIAVLTFFNWSWAQNLIPNPGFEQITGCPGASIGLKNTDNWYGLPNHNGTPDQYYGDCGYNGIINPMAPNQLPFEGQGYAGGFCFYGQYNQGEYLCIELNSPMQKDSVYYIEFYVLPSPRYPNFIDSFGAHFSSQKPHGNGSGLKTQTQFEEHVGNPKGQLIKDTINWTKISGFYSAKGGEKYMTLGNFRNTENTAYEPYQRGNLINPNSAYFFVDGVGVKLNDGSGFDWEVNNQPNKLASNNHQNNSVKDTMSTSDVDDREIIIKDDFETSRNKIKIEIWDHRQVDNDSIDIILDDVYLVENYRLEQKKKKIKLNLEPGTYIFKMRAVNLGEFSPNTAAIRISDGKHTKMFILNSNLEETAALRFIVK